MSETDTTTPEVTKTVTIPLENYLAMRDVYEKNKESRYLIELSLNHTTFFVEPGGEPQEISSLRTNHFSFPDDTETHLTELFHKVHQNSQFVGYLEKRLLEAQRNAARWEELANSFRDQVRQRSLWSRIFN